MEDHGNELNAASHNYAAGWSKWGIALVLSVAAHAGLSGMFIDGHEPVKIAGGATLEIAVLGNAFSDATLAGEVTDEIEPETTTKTQLSPVEPDNILEPTPQKEISPESTEIAEPVEPDVSFVEPTTASPSFVETIETTTNIEIIKTTKTAASEEALTAPSAVLPNSDTTAAIEAAEIAIVSQPLPTPETTKTEIAKPSIVEPVLTAALTEVVTPVDQPETAKPIEPPKKIKKELKPKPVPEKKKSTKKKRPKTKSKKSKPVKKQKQKQAKRSKEKKARSGKRGKANNSSKKGIADGKNKKGATRSGKSNKARRSAGNGNITNYKGKIRRKIVRRFRPGRVKDVKQNVVVRFSVSRNGSASSVRIARSSGSKKLDAAAIRAVRSASPFPPIPSSSTKSSLKVVVPMNVRR